MESQSHSASESARPPTPSQTSIPQSAQKIEYSSEQIRRMDINGLLVRTSINTKESDDDALALRDCLRQENVDMNTLKACLHDPRVDVCLCDQAIWWRATEGDFEATEVVMTHLRELNQRGLEYVTAGRVFTKAVLSGNMKIIEFLATNFPDDMQKVAREQVFDLTRLKSSSKSVDKDEFWAKVIEYLLEQKLLNVEDRSPEGSTLLHYAGVWKKPQLIRVLKEKAANPFARDRSGRTAWEVARPTLTVEDLDDFVINIAGLAYWELGGGGAVTRIPGHVSYERDICHVWVGGTLEDLPYTALLKDIPAHLLDPAHLLERSPHSNRIPLGLLGSWPGPYAIKEHTCWISMGANVDFQFTWYISRVATILGYNKSVVATMIQFHSQTFLEQIGAELRLRIREPSYNAMIQSPADQLSEEREISGSLIGKQNETLADKAGFSNHIPANERGSEADSDSPLRSARDIDWIGNGTPVSYASEKPRGETGKAGPISTPAKPNVVSVVLPYFHSLSKEGLLSRRRLWSEERNQFNMGGLSDRRRHTDELAALVNFHEPRTLDESYYIGMTYEQLSRRNEEQIVGKLASCEAKAKPLLMVPQLWLWMVDNVIISALPTKIGGSDPGIFLLGGFGTWAHPPENIGGDDPITHLQNELKHHNLPISGNLSGLQLLALIISETINFLGRPCSAGLKEPVFYTFESAVATLYDAVQTYVQEYQIDSIQVKQEKAFLNEIHDVFDELNMIKTVIEQQNVIWKKFYNEFRDVIQSWDPNLLRIVTRPNEQIPEFRSRIEKIEKDAQRIQSLIQAQLSLKSNHAALKESHNSTMLGTVVIGFTIVTVIFTPLSFLTSLFALPIDRVEKHKSPDTFNGNFSGDGSNGFDGVYSSGVYGTKYIGKYIATGEIVSLAITGLFVWLAFVLLRWRDKRASAKEPQDFNPYARASQQPPVPATQETDRDRKQSEPSRIARILHPLRPVWSSSRGSAQEGGKSVSHRPTRKAKGQDAV